MVPGRQSIAGGRGNAGRTGHGQGIGGIQHGKGLIHIKDAGVALLLFGIAHLGRHIVLRASHALLITEECPCRRELAGHGAFSLSQRV